MCILCKDEIIARMNIREVRSAGLEIVNDVQDIEEMAYILQRMREIENMKLEQQKADEDSEYEMHPDGVREVRSEPGKPEKKDDSDN